jgi:hypothetical protein
MLESGATLGRNFELILEGLHERHSVHGGIWVQTQNLL